jgi:hypothetical protein
MNWVNCCHGNNYLLFSNSLVCSVLPVARVHCILFKNARRPPKKPKSITPLTRKGLALKLARKAQIFRANLGSKGIEYEWPSFLDQFTKLGIVFPATAATAVQEGSQ